MYVAELRVVASEYYVMKSVALLLKFFSYPSGLYLREISEIPGTWLSEISEIPGT